MDWTLFAVATVAGCLSTILGGIAAVWLYKKFHE